MLFLSKRLCEIKIVENNGESRVEGRKNKREGIIEYSWRAKKSIGNHCQQEEELDGPEILKEEWRRELDREKSRWS